MPSSNTPSDRYPTRTPTEILDLIDTLNTLIQDVEDSIAQHGPSDVLREFAQELRSDVRMLEARLPAMEAAAYAGPVS